MGESLKLRFDFDNVLNFSFKFNFLQQHYILTDIFDENPIIERIWKMPHSRISISGNLGSWWQKNLTIETLTKAIQKKEKLISKKEAILRIEPNTLDTLLHPTLDEKVKKEVIAYP